MAIQVRQLDYAAAGQPFEGAVAADTSQTTRRPAVLVLHGWEGRSEGQTRIARDLAAKGYVGVACDLFGKGIRGELTGDNTRLIAPLLADRGLLRDRLLDTVQIAQSLPEVHPDKLAAIGFCFGGLCALDLARSGAAIRAVASFHGTLEPPATLPTLPIQAKVIVFHGWDDPMAPPAHVIALGAELTRANADWQLHAYGGTMHAFMAPGANRPEAGIQYNARSAKRAWAALDFFLGEAFG